MYEVALENVHENVEQGSDFAFAHHRLYIASIFNIFVGKFYTHTHLENYMIVEIHPYW